MFLLIILATRTRSGRQGYTDHPAGRLVPGGGEGGGDNYT